MPGAKRRMAVGSTDGAASREGAQQSHLRLITSITIKASDPGVGMEDAKRVMGGTVCKLKTILPLNSMRIPKGRGKSDISTFLYCILMYFLSESYSPRPRTRSQINSECKIHRYYGVATRIRPLALTSPCLPLPCRHTHTRDAGNTLEMIPSDTAYCYSWGSSARSFICFELLMSPPCHFHYKSRPHDDVNPSCTPAQIQETKRVIPARSLHTFFHIPQRITFFFAMPPRSALITATGMLAHGPYEKNRIVQRDHSTLLRLPPGHRSLPARTISALNARPAPTTIMI